ncbi:MAG: helix-turn-helix transcriptional regulator [Acidobacteriota bacterium]|nr:helix-turn-helix transcriptional regulator [Acidobacteriota bacterium]
MAVNGRERFGTYLRALREARHLTLEEVERLTSNEVEPVTRSLLSRLENGKARVSTLKLLALARVYRVGLGQLAERLEIDCELALDDLEETACVAPQELLRRARQAVQHGQAYRALFLYEQAEIATLADPRGERAQMCARLGVAGAMLAAARYRNARSVLEALVAEPLCGEDRGRVLFLLSRCYLGLEQHLLAGAMIDSLHRLGGEVPADIAAQVVAVEAEIREWEGSLEPAKESWLLFLDHARCGGDYEGGVRAMVALAGIERRLGRESDASRWLRQARSRAEDLGFAPLLVKVCIERARLDLVRGQEQRARRELAEGRRIARPLRLHRDLFEIYLELWRLAEREGQAGQARACLGSLRQLSRLLERIPSHARDLVERLGWGSSVSAAC